MEMFVTTFAGYRGCQSTANTSALNRLAALLEQGQYEEFRALIGELDDQLVVQTGPRASLGDDQTIVLPDSIYPTLAKQLRELASAPEYEYDQLAEFNPPDSRGRKRSWGIQRVECYRQPKRDYTPNPSGAFWSAVLFHEAPSVEALETVWNQFVAWSGPSKRWAATQLEVEYDGQPEPYAPREAFNHLLNGRTATDGSGAYQSPSKVMGHSFDPFIRRYGDTPEPVQIWFEEDFIYVFTADSRAEVGSVDWDIENFFIYRSLVQTISQIVNTDRFAWWIEADWQVETRALPISKLEDVDKLWEIFTGLVGVERPLNRSKFETSFAAHLKIK